ncbi:hypothetical protein ACVHYJ_17545 [Burkholderia pyrrocinia]
MYFKFSVSNHDAREIVSETRVLKRAAIAQLEQAVELIRHFEDETEQRRAEQVRSNDAAEQAGYETGMQRAAREYADRLFEANQFMAQAATRFEASFAEAVRVAVMRIVEAVPDAGIVERLVRAVYQDMVNEQMTRLVVHEDHRDQIADMFQHLAGAQTISVVGDPTAARRFCRIESSLGSVEMDVDTAIEAVSDLVARALHTARIEGAHIS